MQLAGSFELYAYFCSQPFSSPASCGKVSCCVCCLSLSSISSRRVTESRKLPPCFVLFRFFVDYTDPNSRPQHLPRRCCDVCDGTNVLVILMQYCELFGKKFHSISFLRGSDVSVSWMRTGRCFVNATFPSLI